MEEFLFFFPLFFFPLVLDFLSPLSCLLSHLCFLGCRVGRHWKNPALHVFLLHVIVFFGHVLSKLSLLNRRSFMVRMFAKKTKKHFSEIKMRLQLAFFIFRSKPNSSFKEVEARWEAELCFCKLYNSCNSPK
jgi:hypothetical protein